MGALLMGFSNPNVYGVMLQDHSPLIHLNITTGLNVENLLKTGHIGSEISEIFNFEFIRMTVVWNTTMYSMFPVSS